MEEELDSGGFRKLLEKAVRCDDDVDWTSHTIDYDQFKKRLRVFAQRRAQIRSLIDSADDNRISEDVLRELLGPKTPFPSLRVSVASTSTESSSPVGKGAIVNLESSAGCIQHGDYTHFEDGEEYPLGETSGSDAESLSSKGSGSKKVFVKRRNKRSIMRRLSNAERNEVMLFLIWELDKVQMFYISQWQKISQRLELQQQESTVTGTLDVGLGDEILELFAFCVINIITTHQILIRYDAFARAFEGTPMREYYLKHVKKKATAYRKIFHHDELVAIADSYIEGKETRPLIVNFSAQRFMFQDILHSLECDGSAPPSLRLLRQNHSVKDYFVSVWKWFMIGLFEDRLGLEPAYLTGRGKSLTREIEQLAMWREKKHEILSPSRPDKKLTGMQAFHLTLNLLSAFLYCMNYYIVEPSSTMYVNRLGAHDTMSGTLIGMLPLAAFLSSIPYSMWTNRSFRHPFIMSCCMLVMGNLTYSVADQFGSFRIALAGRFIAGLGAPKCIIRRYMADTTPVSLRTSVNAGFGMVVAAGSAMGPAMAVILNKYEYTFAVPFLGVVTLNGLTLPGYFMAALWFTFTMIVLATFEEPSREGLLEQQAMEKIGAIPGSPSMVSVNTSEHDVLAQPPTIHGHMDEELMTIFSGETPEYPNDATIMPKHLSPFWRWVRRTRNFFDLLTLPVRICLTLLFAKVFTIEALVSATSALSKNRYKWQVQQVGTLGFSNGLLVIPFSMLVGRLSMSYQDRLLMRWLVGAGCLGLFLLIDLSDLVATPTRTYNKGHALAVTPQRYIAGYFVSYISIQAFEGVIGSTLSKVIPTALASGTFNSGLLATLVDTFGRACGDIFISAVGFINLRQLMNLLFIPGFSIMFTCLVLIERFRDMLSV